MTKLKTSSVINEWLVKTAGCVYLGQVLGLHSSSARMRKKALSNTPNNYSDALSFWIQFERHPLRSSAFDQMCATVEAVTGDFPTVPIFSRGIFYFLEGRPILDDSTTLKRAIDQRPRNKHTKI